jgi:aldehyde dehydrogenase (NAD+)
MNTQEIPGIIKKQKEYFNTGETRDITFRIRSLKLLRQAIRGNEDRILDALYKDLHKSGFESYASEIGIIFPEIDYAIRHMRKWARTERVSTPIIHFLSRSYVYKQPYGTVLIIGPWNYPFQLTISPLVAALAAGNTAVIKPSELSPHTSTVIADIVRETYPEHHITVVEGGIDESRTLLSERFDYIFFTGGTAVGRVVMEAAAKHLTPLTLELGGKSPTIVDVDADLALAARRIAWGKFFNAGQTCLAPDYLFVHRAVRDRFIKILKDTIDAFYPEGAKASPDYARIINEKHFSRLEALMNQGTILHGGERELETLFISPTLIGNVVPDHAIMKEEIFGPLFPVQEFDRLEEVIAFINARPRPLALYYFSRNRSSQQRILRETISGGGCINDTVSHVGSTTLPFGGVGDSGMGSYHGKAGFDTFTHRRSILVRSNLVDLALRYPPYGTRLGLLKRLFKLVG